MRNHRAKLVFKYKKATSLDEEIAFLMSDFLTASPKGSKY
jgi:hypothetical protein